ncbi:MAG: hypothetical protein ACFCD0_21185 [Gemmataceae bacterium]
MVDANIVRRMPLRQLLGHTEKCARELHDLVYFTLLTELSDFRDLSRPVRRRSQYPTLVALQNGLRKLRENHLKAEEFFDQLEECLKIVRDHAHRERVNRL